MFDFFTKLWQKPEFQAKVYSVTRKYSNDAELTRALKAHLSFKQNDVYDVVCGLLTTFCEEEQAGAIAANIKGEDRAFQCGRAAALRDFKAQLDSIREEILNGPKNAPSIQSDDE